MAFYHLVEMMIRGSQGIIFERIQLQIASGADDVDGPMIGLVTKRPV